MVDNTKKVRVENPNKFRTGITLSTGVHRSILPGSFALIEPEEYEFLESTSTIFEEGVLCVNDLSVVESIGLNPEDRKRETDEEIIKKLKGGRNDAFQKYIDGIDAIPMQMRIRDIVKEIDLPKTRTDYIEKAFGMTLFDE